MYRFIPPLVVLAPRFRCDCLGASLLTVLRVVYAIVRLSSGKTMVSFRSSMWISSVAGISKILCTSEVASATRTSVREQGILRLGTNFSRIPDFTTMCSYNVEGTLKRPALSININDQTNRLKWSCLQGICRHIRRV